MITFAVGLCPITWTEPTGVAVGSLLRERFLHLHQVGPEHASRTHAEALMFDLLVPAPAHDIQVSMPADPRVREIAERLVADPSDQRELAAGADHVHAGVRTLSRLFLRETGMSFARWRAQVRIRSAIQMLADGASVDAVARASGCSDSRVCKSSIPRTRWRRSMGWRWGTPVRVVAGQAKLRASCAGQPAVGLASWAAATDWARHNDLGPDLPNASVACAYQSWCCGPLTQLLIGRHGTDHRTARQDENPQRVRTRFGHGSPRTTPVQALLKAMGRRPERWRASR